MICGLLIVNADDLGLTSETTDAIVRCSELGGITSTSAMVWMRDSERAAAIARERRLPTGLHLNLDSEFEASEVSQKLRTAHERVSAWFAKSRRHHVVSYNPSPSFRRSLDTTISAQLGEFERRYGREPTHFDGHHHVHLAWNVLTSRAIPAGMPMRSRRTWETDAAEPVRLMRALRGRWLAHRFPTTDLFFDFRGLALPKSRLLSQESSALREFRDRTIEVMAHPGIKDEEEALSSGAWLELIASSRLGSFDDLVGASATESPAGTASHIARS